VLSDCSRYRYALWRIWKPELPMVMFIGLNPSTADAVQDDPTLRRCMNFAKSWGYGAVCMSNLFAYRATEPKDLLRTKDPIGIENDQWLAKLAEDASLIVAAWGNDGRHLDRSDYVAKMFNKLHCFKVNKSGEPAHPLYQRSDSKAIPLVRQ